MNKLALKFFAIGIVATITGVLFITIPERFINNPDFGMIVIGSLWILIALSLVNLFLDLRARHKLGKKKPGSND